MSVTTLFRCGIIPRFTSLFFAASAAMLSESLLALEMAGISVKLVRRRLFLSNESVSRREVLLSRIRLYRFYPLFSSSSSIYSVLSVSKCPYFSSSSAISIHIRPIRMRCCGGPNLMPILLITANVGSHAVHRAVARTCGGGILGTDLSQARPIARVHYQCIDE